MTRMQIRVGFEMEYQCRDATPMILALSIHYSRASDLVRPDHLVTNPAVPVTAYRDLFGNWCSRLVAPPGRFVLSTDALVNDSGLPDVGRARGRAGRRSSTCPSPRWSICWAAATAKRSFFTTSRGGISAAARRGGRGSRRSATSSIGTSSSAIPHARSTRTAWEAYKEGRGVCRDYAHLAVAFCRCMNIPARYCTGYLGDMGTEPPYGTMDFAGWFEAYLGDRWYTFDARNNTPRIGRVLIARGRDACDVALSSTFGPNTLERFKVWADEVPAA